MEKHIRITVLVENTVFAAGLGAEHGLSFWIEYGHKKILFDTGQSGLLLHNAKALGIDIAKADAVILSHGHYDHTGGLEEALKLAENAKVYFHPAVLESKYHLKEGGLRDIGIPPQIRNLLRDYVKSERACYTEKVTEISPGFSITGEIPRNNNFENAGEGFFLDRQGREPDKIADDQALFVQSAKGLVVILGCAHSGVVNTVEYIRKFTGDKKIHLVIGGMHLINAEEARIEKTIEEIDKLNLDELYPCHCSGEKAKRMFWQNLDNKFRDCSTGQRIDI